MNANILNRYPPVNEKEVQRLLEEEVGKNKHKIIVLDDDPTGVQTVHDISVYTDWSCESIKRGFLEEEKLFYILTNSRGLTREETKKCHVEIAQRIAQVSKELGREYILVSRSDSTLRGHYPLETEILCRETEAFWGVNMDGEILCPYFKEGGRFTIDNIHYVKYGEELIPAGETEFAKDRTFGYKSSDLREYIEEKTEGIYKKESVVEISLGELRSLDYTGIEKKLAGTENFGKVIVNAVDACDLKVFCTAFYRTLNKGKHFIFRTAAGMVKELGAIPDKDFLTRNEMCRTKFSNGGLIVVGSHTKKTTEQLQALKSVPGISFIEFDSDLVLDKPAFRREISRVLREEEELLRMGKTVVVYTRREVLAIDEDTPELALRRSVEISDAVQSLVGELRVRPTFIIAKGGITSSDIGTKALKVKKARVMGQLQPGVPVWETGKESLFPGIPYVIFPGNVGEEKTLKAAVEILTDKG